MEEYLHRRIDTAMDFTDMVRFMEEKIEQSRSGGQFEKIEKTRLNYQRYKRITGTYQPSKALVAEIEALPLPQIWLVLTEDWCGDSWQILPYIHKMALQHPEIYMKLLLRDENLDIMDVYHSMNNRNIPVIIGFDKDYQILFKWGPRPQPAAELFRRSVDRGLSTEDAMQKLHAWYAEDKGQTLEAEFISIFSNLRLLGEG